ALLTGDAVGRPVYHAGAGVIDGLNVPRGHAHSSHHLLIRFGRPQGCGAAGIFSRNYCEYTIPAAEGKAGRIACSILKKGEAAHIMEIGYFLGEAIYENRF